MRIACPHCHQRFDVSHGAVLKEAARLAEKRKAAPAALPAREGNVLDPKDATAAADRQAAIARRLREDGFL
jgi:hypothetical protein